MGDEVALDNVGPENTGHLQEPDNQPENENTETAVIDQMPEEIEPAASEGENQGGEGEGEEAEIVQGAKEVLTLREPDIRGRPRPIDYILAYADCDNEEESNKRKAFRALFESNLAKAGLVLENAAEEGEVSEITFTHVHAPYATLFLMAEETKMRMPLVWNDWEQPETFFQSVANKITLIRDVIEPPVFPEDDDDIEHLAVKNPYNYFTAEYEQIHWDKFAVEKMGIENFFTVADRIRIVRHILDNAEFQSATADTVDEKGDTVDGEQRLAGITRMVGNGSYSGAYPLHPGEYNVQTKGSGFVNWIKHFDELNPRQKLFYAWGSPKAWYKKQPVDPIRRYFGEKICMYFSWLGYYTRMLLLASVVGIIVFVGGLAGMSSDKEAADACKGGADAGMVMCPRGDYPSVFWLLSDACTNIRLSHIVDNTWTVVFAIFMALWSTMFLEFWKREQNQLQYEWDLFDFEESQETLRPEYEERARTNANWLKTNPVTKSVEPFVPGSYTIPRLLMSTATVSFMIFLVVAAIVGVVVYRAIIFGVMASSHNVTFSGKASPTASVTGACLNLMAIMTFSIIYGKLATFLTDIECPRTQTEYEDSYTLKMFAFQFVNYYSSIMYIAFFKGRFAGYPGNYNLILGYRQEECAPGGCLMELATQLVIIMIGKQFINNVKEIAIPLLKNYVQMKKLAREEKRKYEIQKATCTEENIVQNVIDTRWEKDYLLSPQAPMNLFDEYLEMVIQYGFTTLFATAFPLAPFFAFINNVIEIRLDAFKFISQLQRPWSQKAQDIGSWYGILDAVSVLAVLTTAFLIAITSTYIDRLVFNTTTEGLTFWNFAYTSVNATLLFNDYPCQQSVMDFMQVKDVTDCHPDKCFYQAYRNNFDDINPGQINKYYWHVLAARLIFVILFEHAVFFIRALIAYAVPDMPGDIKVQQLREEHLTRTVLYQAAHAGLDQSQKVEKDEEDAPLLG